MSGRSRLLALHLATLVVSFGLIAAPAPRAFAQAVETVVPPEVANSRFQFAGVINAADVYLRSGPGEAYYTTMKLPASTPVTVVGIKFDWLKIVPPPGSFGLVSKLYVDREGDGSVGRVNRADVNVRAGSDLTATKSTVMARLNTGDEVKIIGDVDEYWKVDPPAGSYLYINKQFVDPVKQVTVASVTPDQATAGDVALGTPAAQATEKSVISNSVTMAGDATTRPVLSDAVAAAPATQPSGPPPSVVAEATFQGLESEFTTASAKPLEDQPVPDLAKRYEAVMKDPALPWSDQQTAGFRLAVLKIRADAQQRLADVHKMEADASSRDQTLKAEQDELQKRLDANDVKLYAAVGQLEPSSLQYGAQTIYRLTDPASGRTVIYVRGDDAAVVKLLHQFVGVRGDVTADDKLDVKVIPFSVIEAVDPLLVNTKVIAGITPPSLTSSPINTASVKPSASTGN
jgi:uncharacterized protein YgiM (DUF1202 family)